LASVFSVLLRYMDYDYPFGLQTFLDITILTELSHFLHLLNREICIENHYCSNIQIIVKKKKTNKNLSSTNVA
jgi:hypothetical protein